MPGFVPGCTGCGGGCLRGCLGTLAAIGLALLAAWLVMPPLLTSYAQWLTVEDRWETADAAVALSGGDGERLHASIGLYKQHQARAILLVGPDQPLLKVYTGGDSLTQAEAKRRIILSKKIPSDSVIVATGAYSTWDEAHLTLRAARARGWSSIVIVTDPFHTRRARATFRHVFRNEPVEILAYHLPPGRTTYSPVKWWARERDFMAVVTESIKLPYYAWRHRVWPWS